MGNLYNKANAPYLIAGTLATLTLLASGVFAIAPYVAFLSPIAAFNVVLPVALSVSIFSILVLALSYKIIKNNKEIEIEKNKFAKQNTELGNTKQQLEAILKELNNRDSQIRELKDKIRELNNKIIEVVDAASKQTEKLNDQLHKLTRKRLDADKEVENWKSILSEEKESFEQKLEGKTNRIAELCRMVNELEKIINTPYKQEKKLHYKRIKGLLHCKISRLREQCVELENKGFYEEIEKLYKEREVLYEKGEKCYQEREELCVELDRLRCKIAELIKENKNLSKKLEEQSKELCDVNNFLNDQSFELERINKGYDNEVKELKNSLLSKSFERRQCEEDLLKKKKEEVVFMQQMIEYVVGKVEQSVKGSEEMIDDDKTIILQIIQKIRSLLEEEMAQYLSGKTSVPSWEDLGYESLTSRSSTPIEPLPPSWKERYEHSQSNRKGFAKCNN